MKKTIIAAAIASVVAAPAMAEVSISGNVKYKLTDTDANAGDWGGSLDNSITFKATEDLGNGMSAFAQITLDPDEMDHSHSNTATTTTTTDATSTAAGVAGSVNATSTSTTTMTNASNNLTKDQKIGLTGDFGTVVMGRMEYLFEGVVSAKMDVAGLESASLTENGRVNAIGYVSPTVNGVHIAAAGNQSDTTDSGLFQHKEVLVAYDNGPLSVIASHADVADAHTYQTLYLGYKVGDLSLAAMTTEKDFDAAGTADIKDNIFRLDYAMGNNKLTLGTKSSDTAGQDRDIIKLVHSMSKRTSIYAEHADVEAVNSDFTTLGINHNF